MKSNYDMEKDILNSLNILASLLIFAVFAMDLGLLWTCVFP